MKLLLLFSLWSIALFHAASGAPAVFGDWRADAPGRIHHITVDDLPRPFATPSAGNSPNTVARPASARLLVPAHFAVNEFATGLKGPRTLRIAPNGDVFLAETGADQVRVLRVKDGAATASRSDIFARGLREPFGIAFYPLGPQPQWVYVANTNSVVRFPYHVGDLKARGAPQIIVKELAQTTGGHSTRDIAFSSDGLRMFVSVGSRSNVGEDIGRKTREEARRWEAEQALGAAWDGETHRADVLVFDPEGKERRIFATGIRNGVGLAVNPTTGDLWCVTNERDGLGDDLVPDFATRVREGAFYGWPWYYLGGREDPRHKGERPELLNKVTVPDVLFQPHSAPLGIVFYPTATEATAFPAEYRGDAFVALHGSWNRRARTGYKVVRLAMRNGVATGEYQDFLTGFVIDDERVWGRPVGVAVAHDGALLVSDDGSDTLWRISYHPD